MGHTWWCVECVTSSWIWAFGLFWYRLGVSNQPGPCFCQSKASGRCTSAFWPTRLFLSTQALAKGLRKSSCRRDGAWRAKNLIDYQHCTGHRSVRQQYLLGKSCWSEQTWWCCTRSQFSQCWSSLHYLLLIPLQPFSDYLIHFHRFPSAGQRQVFDKQDKYSTCFRGCSWVCQKLDIGYLRQHPDTCECPQLRASVVRASRSILQSKSASFCSCVCLSKAAPSSLRLSTF